ncbi:hypothetical protein [Paenibacillus campi]|uniref:hypothetical protein n=1 Tax=Paenibacillus campi TaxID=3106031 RepID=UPI002AFFF248|nr:hypothetical protein [Paenibacillus sp. SGZ-1009]
MRNKTRSRPERSDPIHILEQVSISKHKHTANEDALVVTDHFIAVIDGVTSKVPLRYDGKTTGRIAMELVRQHMQQLTATTTVHQFINSVNNDFLTKWHTIADPHLHHEQPFQAVAAIYSHYYRQIWLIGDCQLQIDGQYYANPKQSDTILSDMRSLILTLHEWQPELVPTVDDPGRAFILPWIQQACLFANRDIPDYGYAVLNGQPIPERLLRVFQLDDGAHEIILASDGYPRIESTLAQTEAYLQAQLRHDPMCYKHYRSTKGMTPQSDSFDDRTYIRFQI